MLHAVFLLPLIVSSYCDEVHMEESRPRRGYAYAYTAGKYPGHTDQHHAEVSDGSGAVRGTFSYVDPSQTVRRVDYVADKDGFRPKVSEDPSDQPKDSHAVARQNERNNELYERIADDHASYYPYPPVRGTVYPRQTMRRVDYVPDGDGYRRKESELPSESPEDTYDVARAKERHHELYERIAADHASYYPYPPGRGHTGTAYPRQTMRRIDYVPDGNGYRQRVSELPSESPEDTYAVARAKERHHELYERVAANHASYYPNPQVRDKDGVHPIVIEPLRENPDDSYAVSRAKERHHQLYGRIVADHASYH